MTVAGPVDDRMLQTLARYYERGSAPPRGTRADRESRFPVQYDVDEPVLLHLPGIDEDPTLIGTDGSSSDRLNTGGFAAVRGDGWALAGAFKGPIVTSMVCEVEGIRFALRLVEEHASVLVRLDSTRVISEVMRLTEGREIRPSPVRDWDALNEIEWHLRRRGIHLALQRIPDAEGGTDSERIPSDPLMGAAHRLAWSVRQMRLYDIPLEGDALAWLRQVGASGKRWSSEMHEAWAAFWRRHRS